MKIIRPVTAVIIVLILGLSLVTCTKSTDEVEETQPAAVQTEPAQTTQPSTAKPTETQPATTAQTATTAPEETKPPFDPVATSNVYDMSSDWFEAQNGTDYGTLITDVEYFSATAGDYKRCNILLPPNYDKNGKYPVLYMIHGWGADYTAHVFDGSYLHLLYGNLYRENLCEPMIIVGVDMYTAKQSEKDESDGYHMRYSYDKVVDDLAYDLMPYMKEHYAVAEGRANTAVAGVSEGGARSLCTGFKWPDKFGYIASIAPDGNAIATTDNYMNSYWTIPYFEDGFPQPSEENEPYYIYLAVGSKDPWNIYATEYYSQVINSMGLTYQYDYVEGYGHDSGFWRVCMYNYLQKIFKN